MLRRQLASERSASRFLRLAGAGLLIASLPLVLLAGSGGIALGSAFAAGGLACLVASLNLGISAQARADERHQREMDASAALASRLHSSRDHSGQFFGGTRLMHRLTVRGTSFREAVLDRAEWSEVSLDGCDFRKASLLSTRLTVSTAAEANFDQASLSKGEIEALAPGASFRGAECARTDFRRCLLDNSSFASLPARTTYLRGADFSESSALDAVDFTRAHAEDARFHGTTLYGTVFDDAFLANASFEGAALYGVSFRGAMLAGFAGDRPARFAGADFGDEWFAGELATDLSATWLVGVDLSGVENLSSASLTGALANPNTKFPPGVDPGGLGVLLLHEMPREQAQAAVESWKRDHARPAGWLS